MLGLPREKGLKAKKSTAPSLGVSYTMQNPRLEKVHTSDRQYLSCLNRKCPHWLIYRALGPQLVILFWRQWVKITSFSVICPPLVLFASFSPCRPPSTSAMPPAFTCQVELLLVPCLPRGDRLTSLQSQVPTSAFPRSTCFCQEFQLHQREHN